MAASPSFPISNYQKSELIAFARLADKEARSDLSLGFIIGEDDYTSNFTGALRRIINANSNSGLVATSFLLPTSLERHLGCDGCIIISTGATTKIAAFEAKWPRFSQANYAWDYAQTSSGLSHFSDQLDRQQRYSDLLAIFQMIYCDHPFGTQPAYLNDELSSCVWHQDAIAFDQTRSPNRTPWTQAQLQSLLTTNRMDIGHVLESVCNCSAGRPLLMSANPKYLAQEFGIGGQILHVEARSKND